MRFSTSLATGGLILALSAGAASAQAVNGTITKVDTDQGKLTVSHGPIKTLDMDGMTMVFRVADPAMMKGLKAGDKILFDADRVNGAITITRMQKAR